MEDYLFTNLLDTTCDSFMAQTSDELCRRVGVTREETDAYAVLSHTRTENSVDNGVWSNEIVDVETPNGMVTAADEDHFVRGTSEESLAGLRTHFGPTSLVTAGNASGVVDGAAAVVVKSASQAKADGDQPLARLVDWGIVGLDPKNHGLWTSSSEQTCSRASRDASRGYRLVGNQRSLRRASSRLHEGTWNQPRNRQYQRRRSRTRSPSGCDWDAPRADAGS